jgi:hypothetical protein
MSPSKLTPHDAGVLIKIKDPESSISPVLIDENLRRDPHIMDMSVYESIVETEKTILKTIVTLDNEQIICAKENYQRVDRNRRSRQLANWLACILRLDKLIEKHPNYASAKNNRVQALRTMYGDGLLVKCYSIYEDGKAHTVPDGYPALDIQSQNNDLTMQGVSRKVLRDLNSGIDLLAPKTSFAAVSPTQARTLSQLYTQRGQLYYAAAKKLGMAGGKVKAVLRDSGNKKEGLWSKTDFEENASVDFLTGGRYGNDLAKAVAVQMNPMAKLCGEMVKEAMRNEYAGGDTPMVNVADKNAKPKVGNNEDIVMEDFSDADATMQKVAAEDTIMKVDSAVDAMGRELANTTMEEVIGEQPIEEQLTNANEESEWREGMNTIEEWDSN